MGIFELEQGYKMHSKRKTSMQLADTLQPLYKELNCQKDFFDISKLQANIIASAMDAIIVIEESQNIMLFNTAAEQVFGYKAIDILGKPVHMLLPESFRESHRKYIQDYDKTEATSRAMGSLGILTGLHANGDVFPMEASISQTKIGRQKFFTVILRDVSQRESLENLIMRQYNSLNTLHTVTLDLLNRRDIKDLLQFIVDQAIKLLDVSYCEILLPDGNELVAQAFTRHGPFLANNRFTRSDSLLSWQVFDTGLPVVLEDYSTWPHRHAIYETEQFHATATLPLLVGNQCIGVLGLTRDKPNYKFNEEQILTATRLAAIAALAIENSRLYLEVKQLATIDELTGVHNRRSLMNIGERDILRAVRYKHPLSALMLDVDHFKRINDTWGHATGDIVLRGVAQECLRHIRKTDVIGRSGESPDDHENIIGRFGGEEFAILLPETPLEGSVILAERIRSSVEQIIFKVPDLSDKLNAKLGTEIHITVSIGVSCMTSKMAGFLDLLKSADQALYEAKENGRNQVRAVSVCEQ